MSLENAILGLTTELKRYNDNHEGIAPANVVPITEEPKEAPAAKKAAKPKPTEPKEAPAETVVEKTGVTEDDLKALGMKLMKGKKMKEYTTIVKKYGASKVSDLDPAAYDKCYADLNEEVNKI